jgi:hypothetical protein
LIATGRWLQVVPYWGNTQDRKVLRKFWTSENPYHTKAASFHVVITSYQLIIADAKYFHRIKWHYMVLDEAQAIKSVTRYPLPASFNTRIGVIHASQGSTLTFRTTSPSGKCNVITGCPK